MGPFPIQSYRESTRRVRIALCERYDQVGGGDPRETAKH